MKKIIFSCILFLNNDYEGGELCFKNTFDDEEVAVKPLPGKLIIWPSNIMFPHTVKPVKKGIRYTVVGWAR
jgi:predicted 2-oxoglutarate/Fe(II)-dependent dioxygenase YbiX